MTCQIVEVSNQMLLYTLFCPIVKSDGVERLPKNVTLSAFNVIAFFTKLLLVEMIPNTYLLQGYINRYNLIDRLSGSCNFCEINTGL